MILEKAETGIQLTFAPPPSELLDNVNESEIEISVIPEENYVAAVIRLRAFNETSFTWRVRSIPAWSPSQPDRDRPRQYPELE